jgi:hypothetical protein
MANPYQPTSDHKRYVRDDERLSNDQTSLITALALIALIVIGGIGYAYYYEAHTSDDLTTMDSASH